MDKQQKQGVSSSSLLDLKAELLRKKEEFQRQKLLGHTNRQHHETKQKKDNIWSRSNAGVQERAQRDYEVKKEEDDVLAKSKKMLEVKARVYEKMASGNTIPDPATSERFLVDFERKAINKLIVQKHEREEALETRLIQGLKDPQGEDSEVPDETTLCKEITESVKPDEDWVDYVDSFGRSRRCLKEDLPRLMKMDQELTGKKMLLDQATQKDGSLPELMSDDMYREKLREKWEEEERQNLEQPESHYANVQFNEVRDHGVAYYQFDKDAEIRQHQMDKLTALREKTKQNREAQKNLKKKRKAMMAARLAKVRQRKLIREGKDPSEIIDVPEILDDSDDDDDLLSPDMKEKSKDQSETLQRDDSWKKTAPVREWDKGKEGIEDFLSGCPTVYSEESWKEKLRQERHSEFAPPSIYIEERHPSGFKSKHNFERKSLLFGNKKLKVETDKNTGLEVNEPMKDGSKQTKPSAVDVGTMVARIRAEVEIGQSTASSSASKEDTHDIDLNDIPLPPTTHIVNETTEIDKLATTSETLSAVQIVLSQSSQSRNDATISDEASDWNRINASQCPSEYNLYYKMSNTPGEGNHEEQKTAEADVSACVSKGAATSDCSVPEAARLGPQPAHYASGPMKPQAPKARYERVNLHELPLELPAPPTVSNVPEYPSQEDIFGIHKTARSKTAAEDEAAKLWKKQFVFGNKQHSASLKPDNIPFASSYIQGSVEKEAEPDPALKFDPSKPPPNMT